MKNYVGISLSFSALGIKGDMYLTCYSYDSVVKPKFHVGKVTGNDVFFVAFSGFALCTHLCVKSVLK